ncbi:hypothetical protein BC829DRAFT_439821 [Chytridium lagenaria]|nr:hypothetical protein BC829DRAFT_439821 [Chytridium lagenaria]
MAGFSRGDAFNLSSYLRPRLLLLALLSLLMIYLLLATILNFLPEPALHASEPSSSFRITLPFTPPEMPPKRPVSNTNLGDPLFDTPNSKFDKAVQLLKNTSHIPPSPSVSSKYDRFAVALKTGADVAVERASVQLVTFLSKIKKLAVIGEAPGFMLERIP